MRRFSSHQPPTDRRSWTVPYPLPPLRAALLIASGLAVWFAMTVIGLIGLPILAFADFLVRSRTPRGGTARRERA